MAIFADFEKGVRTVTVDSDTIMVMTSHISQNFNARAFLLYYCANSSVSLVCLSHTNPGMWLVPFSITLHFTNQTSDFIQQQGLVG